MSVLKTMGAIGGLVAFGYQAYRFGKEDGYDEGKRAGIKVHYDRAERTRAILVENYEKKLLEKEQEIAALKKRGRRAA
jgi:hypothetical protein